MKRFNTPLLLQISIAHFLSHVHMMVIPALLPLIPGAFNISFVDAGISIGLFNIVSALMQTPLGFAADRYGPRNILIFGLTLGSLCFILLGIFPNKASLFTCMGFAGLANAVYHPSNYAILSQSMQEAKMGRSFSMHSFAGYAGGAITPGLLTTIAVCSKIDYAIFVAGIMGLICLAVLLLSNYTPPILNTEDSSHTKKPQKSILVVPVIVLTILFALFSLSTATIERFSVSALMQGHGFSLAISNIALTAFLFCSAAGVLCGGMLADKTKKHGYIATAAFILAIFLLIPVVLYKLPVMILISLFAVIGLLTGVIVPSRDMMVRSISPKGSEGKTFGIVTTGFNIGNTIGPITFGYLLEHGLPFWIFWGIIIAMTATSLLAIYQESPAFKKFIPE